MSCNTLTSFTLGCRDNSGGIQEVYIGKYEKNQTYILGTSSNTDQIIDFTGTTASFYTFEQTLEAAEFTDVPSANIENHTSMFEQTLTIILPKMTASLNNLVKILNQGKWRAIVLDKNGNYFYLGDKGGLTLASGSGGAGKTMDSLNGYTLTFSGKEQGSVLQVTTAAALQLITS
jgi:hypothetical protein